MLCEHQRAVVVFTKFLPLRRVSPWLTKVRLAEASYAIATVYWSGDYTYIEFLRR